MLARARAAEGEQRRREADLGAELARLLLGAAKLDSALGPAAQRIAAAFELPVGGDHTEPAGMTSGAVAIPLDAAAGTLLVPARHAGARARHRSRGGSPRCSRR